MKGRLTMLTLRLAIGVFLLGFGLNSLWKRYQLDHEGTVVPAVISSVSPRKSTFQYRFEAQGGTYFGFASGSHYVGESLPIKYLPRNPNQNQAVHSSDLNPGWFFTGFSIVWFVFTALVYRRSSLLGLRD